MASAIPVVDEDVGSNVRPVHVVQWDVQHEATAIDVYEMCENVEVTPSGLWLAAHRLVGASPDGFIGSTKTVDVKCTYSATSVPLRQLDLGECDYPCREK